MSLTWIHTADNIDWDELSRLYEIAPLGHKDPKDLKTAFTNSRYVCFLYDSEQLVGAGRALADGVDCSYLCDLAVHPDHQGRGLGKAILNDLLERSQGHKKVILYAAPGKEDFYHRQGFRRMTTAMAIFHDQNQARVHGLVADT